MSERISRVDQTAATRRRVIEQARDLFLAQGYAATTTRQIAAGAGVTERTLFNTVPSKGDLLREVLLAYVYTGDFGPLLQRRDFQGVLRATTVERFLAAFTRWVLALHQQTGSLAEMTSSAAAVDAAAAEMWSVGNAQQVTDLCNLSEELRRRGWLRSGTTPAYAAQSLAALCSHETYWRLVVVERVSPHRYRRWLQRHCAVEVDP